jgi:hypothetical protein
VSDCGVVKCQCGLAHLSRDSVRASWEELGDAGGLEASLGQTEGSTETSTTGTDNHGIVCVVDHGVRL